jgi:hypothetical protein
MACARYSLRHWYRPWSSLPLHFPIEPRRGWAATTTAPAPLCPSTFEPATYHSPLCVPLSTAGQGDIPRHTDRSLSANMSTTAPDAEDVDASSVGSLLSGNAGAALKDGSTSWNALWAAMSFALAGAGVQMLVFVLLRWRLTRIYRPRTYLVPERERVPIPPHGLIGWIKPVFATPSLHIIQKCGLDAYFFIRYLRMLLKIFAPMLVVLTPILLPINAKSADGESGAGNGLARLTIGNVNASVYGRRLWAHLILTVLSIFWILYNIYYELRSYIRVRQAYLTSPEHRIRASATTVLVTGIPAKWLTIQALDGLYDVFPGGIRNIWINRNYDAIADKVSKRDDMVQSLEEAETNLIRRCRKRHEKQMKQKAKAEKREDAADTSNGHEMSSMDGTAQQSSNEKEGRSPNGLDVRPNPPRIPSNYAEAGGQIPHPPETLSSHQARPRSRDSDQQPLRGSQETAVETAVNQTHEPKETPGQVVSGSKWYEKLMFWNSQLIVPSGGYPSAMSKDFDDDKDENATWRKYIEPKDRETMRLPVVNQDWFPALPWVGQKVDRIYYCRKELARLNAEIEADQANAENYPYMNSAFIQFNHQVAAHMACQSVSHHTPHTMTPRIVEISPNDVLWDNMSIKWWERYIRVTFVVAISAGLIILYAIPVTFTSLLSNIAVLADQVTWLAWLDDFPEIAKSIIQGVLPPAILQLILILVPIIYRTLVKFQGVPTGNDREMGVQKWYFVFLFVQVCSFPCFLVPIPVQDFVANSAHRSSWLSLSVTALCSSLQMLPKMSSRRLRSCPRTYRMLPTTSSNI